MGSKNILPGLQINHALVDMQCRARFALHRLGHEGGVHVVALRSLADRALEHEYLVRHRQRVAMVKIDLELGRAVLVNQGIDIELLLISEVIHVLNEILEFRHGVDAIRQSRHFAPTGAALGRHQFIVGVGVFVHEVELHLGRHHRLQACLFI